jgi:RNA polymerase primary sigma factor
MYDQDEQDISDILHKEDVTSASTAIKDDTAFYYHLVSQNAIVLSKDEQDEVVKLIRKAANPEEERILVTKLCNANLKLVYKIAKSYSYNRESLSVYISAGNEGLLKAVQKYQLGKAPFPNYAAIWIRQRILHEIYTNTLLKIPAWRIKSFIRMKVLVSEAGDKDPPTVQELAKTLDLPEATVRELQEDPFLKKIIDRSLDDTELPVQSIYDESLIDSSKLQVSVDIDVEAQKVHLKELIMSALKFLSNEQRFVVLAYYGMIDGKPKKLWQIAKVLCRTPERVRQLRNEALKTLKELLTAAGITSDDVGDYFR